MNRRTQKFVPVPKHAFDLKSHQQVAQAVNSLLNSSLRMGKTADVHHSDSNVVYEVPMPVIPEFIFPFKIYNIENATDKSLNAQTFQVRDGLVGFRPNYIYTDSNIIEMQALCANGNYELPLMASGTDGLSFAGESPWQFADGQNAAIDFGQSTSPNLGGAITFDGSEDPLLIYSNSPDEVNRQGVQIVIDPGSDVFFQVSFFVVIIDDVDGAYTELWASRADGVSVVNFSKTIINYEQTFAVGEITFASGGYVISQMQYGHLLNRYLEFAPKPSNDTTGSQPKFYGIGQVNRGSWTANSLSGKLFYPGDIVINDTVSIGIQTVPAAGFNAYKSYVYVHNGIKKETAPPPGAGWQEYGIVPHQ